MTDLPIGFCLDTCHLLASGYDVATRGGLKKMVARSGPRFWGSTMCT